MLTLPRPTQSTDSIAQLHDHIERIPVVLYKGYSSLRNLKSKKGGTGDSVVYRVQYPGCVVQRLFGSRRQRFLRPGIRFLFF